MIAGVAQVAQAPGGQIAFRPESSGLATHAFSSLLVALLLLAVVFALALLAKRKGLLDRWVPRGPRATSSGLRVVQTVRLSPKTVVYRIEDERLAYLIVESTVRTQLVSLEPEQHEQT